MADVDGRGATCKLSMLQHVLKARAVAVSPGSLQRGISPLEPRIGSRNQAILEINPQHNVIKALKNAMETQPEAAETEDMATWPHLSLHRRLLWAMCVLLSDHSLSRGDDGI